MYTKQGCRSLRDPGRQKAYRSQPTSHRPARQDLLHSPSHLFRIWPRSKSETYDRIAPEKKVKSPWTSTRVLEHCVANSFYKPPIAVTQPVSLRVRCGTLFGRISHRKVDG